jgi:hypothetical protein
MLESVKAKRRQAATPARQSRRRSELFLWHFQQSRLTPYSHFHWWLKQNMTVPLESAVWELMRRHPNAREAHIKMHILVLPTPLVAFVGCHCFKAWSELSKSLQTHFVRCLWAQCPAGHGFIAPPVTVLNDHRRFRDYHQRLETTGQRTRLSESANWLALQVQTSALKAHHAGQILLAIDPHAPPSRITKGVASAIADWLNGAMPMNTGKSRISQWLDVVAKFEAAESSRPKKEKRGDQLFARYRRTIQDWPLLS